MKTLMTPAAAQARVAEIAKTLTAYDFKPMSAVLVRFENDAGFMFFESAFVLHELGWYLVFTEHNGHGCWPIEDTLVIEYIRVMQVRSASTFRPDPRGDAWRIKKALTKKKRRNTRSPRSAHQRGSNR